MIHCQRRHHTNITYRASSEHLESIYNVLCRDCWGHVFTRHNVYIIQTRIFTPGCHHCWNLQRLLDPSEPLYFVCCDQGDDIMTEDRGCGVTFVTGPPSSPSSLVPHASQGMMLKVYPSQPPNLWTLCPVTGDVSLFPISSPRLGSQEHANFHSAVKQGGAQHQHCLTHLYLSLCHSV